MFTVFTCFIVLFPLAVDLPRFAAKLWVYPLVNCSICSIAIVPVTLAIRVRRTLFSEASGGDQKAIASASSYFLIALPGYASYMFVVPEMAAKGSPRF